MRVGLACAAMVLGLWAGAARAEPVEIPLADGTKLQAVLTLPLGPVTAPAVVMLHGCGGPYPSRDNQWRDALSAQGHIVLAPNSFSSRGLKSQCRERSRVATASGLRRTDAIASAKWLAAQALTPAGGVAIMGWSDGGSTVMAVAPAAADLPQGLVRGFVAFYPGCGIAVRDPAWKPVAPLLILMGAADDWTPAAPCQSVAARFSPDEVRMIAYPGAYHDFDAPGGIRVMRDMPNSQNADKTVHAGTDPAGREDALKQVSLFLDGLTPVP